MKLVKQTTLFFSDGKSDKVYEVDLCESGSDLFIVNFRYGRRGANLREGTKTVFPVPFEEAEKIFNKLVVSKEKKGYAESGEIATAEVKPKTAKPKANTAREETILTYLKEASLGTYKRNWKVSRIIMRTIALEMKDAVDLIKPFITSKDEFEQYAAIYALHHFKDTSEIENIFTVFKKSDFTSKVGRIAVSFLLKYGNDAHFKSIKEQLIKVKPENVSLTEDVVLSVASYLLNDLEFNKDEKPVFGKKTKKSRKDASIIYYAYLSSFKDEKLRKQLFSFIEQTPLKVDTFKSIRYIYRTAEITNDVPMLTLLAKRIAIGNQGYNSTSWGMYIGNSWVSPSDEKIKKNPRIAFSSNTKAYFNKTAYKLVYNYSKNDTDSYVAYATTLLCSLNDKIDNQKRNVETLWDYDYDANEYKKETRYYPKYTNFLALLYIVYGNSSKINGVTKKYFIENFNLATVERTEILSEIWNTKPTEVLTILADAKSEIAVDFSLKIINDNPAFLENISEELLSKLVNHYDARVLDIILPLLKEKYKNTQPEENLLFALLQSNSEKANKIAMEWLQKYEAVYFTAHGFVAKLLLLEKPSIITYLKEIYKDEVKYNVPFVITEISTFFEKGEDSYAYLITVNELIGKTYFGKLLSETSEEKIKLLAGSSIIINKLFAINLAKHNKLDAFQLFKDDFDSYINSDNEVIRKAGIEILSHFPDAFLLENQHKIGGYCFSVHAEVREAIQPTIERLLELDVVFKEKFLTQLLNTIIEEEEFDGTHETSYSLLIQFYDKTLPTITTQGIVCLILSDYDFAQKLGTPLYKERVVLKDFSMEELIEVSTSAVLEIRESIHAFFKENIDRVNYELEEALRIFNGKWQDVTDWAITYLEKSIKPENWTIDILLYVADHTKKDVQAFGRKLITQNFSEDKGLPLLLKLQEHPTKAMQFFVTNYLDNYATDKEAIILQLENFFKTSLFNINTNRPTKTRIYAFLEQESVKNEQVAKMTIKIINSVIGTKTLLDHSNNIDLLLAIVVAHPNLEVPLTIKSV